MSTVFEKIIARELPADIVFESERLIAIKDIQPAAPVHLLIISKKCIDGLQSMEPEDRTLMEEVVEVAQNLAKKHGIEDNYRLLTNNGEKAGQTIFHLHFHLIGGRDLGPLA